jgi:hypothetical protein
MKKALFLAITVILVLIAGCTTTSPSNSATVAVTAVTPTPTLVIPAGALPMDASVRLGNDTHSITVSICNVSSCEGTPGFSIDPLTSSGKQTLSVYVNARNTGKDLIRYTWFSKLTDLNGNSYGGIGLSHGGYGARMFWRSPGQSEEARDYVDVSNQSLAELSQGAILDVYFMEYKQNQTLSLIPDYHVTWVVNPGVII